MAFHFETWVQAVYLTIYLTNPNHETKYQLKTATRKEAIETNFTTMTTVMATKNNPSLALKSQGSIKLHQSWLMVYEHHPKSQKNQSKSLWWSSLSWIRKLTRCLVNLITLTYIQLRRLKKQNRMKSAIKRRNQSVLKQNHQWLKSRRASHNSTKIFSTLATTTTSIYRKMTSIFRMDLDLKIKKNSVSSSDST